MEKIYDKPDAKADAVEHLILGRFKNNHLLELRRLVGPEIFRELIEKYPSTHFRIPAASGRNRVQADVEELFAFRKFREARRTGSSDDVRRAEAELKQAISHNRASIEPGQYLTRAQAAAKMKTKQYKAALRRAIETEKEIAAAKQWLEELQGFDRARMRDPWMQK